MPDALLARRAYVLPSGGLCYGAVNHAISSEDERAWRRRFYAWAATTDGQVWLAAHVEERDARRAGAIAALTRECPLPSPTFAAVLAEARARGAQGGGE